ncbi:MAG TPA: TetR/AcrR family transcriptional regulator [Geobacteraceae bacterium]|nr:TetR/AcrR family transcriptional regulator [Geobacteraceae bacterium]
MNKNAMTENRENPVVRERLLGEALRLFTARGYAATTVREIVEAVGVTKPVLYYYFGSKEGLYLEIMNGIVSQFDKRVEELEMGSGSVRQRLVRFFAGMFAAARENLAVVRLAFSIYYGPPQGAPFIDFHRFFDLTLEKVDLLIAEGMERGEIRPGERRSLVWALVGSYHTILEEQVCRTPARMDRDDLAGVINMILDGVAPVAKPAQ